MGDKVEVYYEPEGDYFAATITRVVHYEDDVRYSVRYKIDRSRQANVSIDSIRLIKSQNDPDEQEPHSSISPSEKIQHSTNNRNKHGAKRKRTEKENESNVRKGHKEYVYVKVSANCIYTRQMLRLKQPSLR